MDNESFSIPPQYIALEGGAGCGKTTAIDYLIGLWVGLTGRSLVVTREPGGTKELDKYREGIFAAKKAGVSGEVLVGMFNGVRYLLLNGLVKPELAKGSNVITDRCFASTFAWEGGGEGVSPTLIRQTHEKLFGNFGPNLTYYFRLSNPATGLRRKRGNDGGDHFDFPDLGYHERVHKVYDALYRKNNNPEKIDPILGLWILIDADKSVGAVRRQLHKETVRYLRRITVSASI